MSKSLKQNKKAQQGRDSLKIGIVEISKSAKSILAKLGGEGGKVGKVCKVNCLMSHVGISRLMRIGRFKPTQGFCDQGRSLPAWVTRAAVVRPG